MAIKWRGRSEGLPVENDNRQVLVFSPVYPKGNHMRYRLMGAQFVKFCEEVTYWVYMDDLEPEEAI